MPVNMDPTKRRRRQSAEQAAAAADQDSSQTKQLEKIPKPIGKRPLRKRN